MRSFAICIEGSACDGFYDADEGHGIGFAVRFFRPLHSLRTTPPPPASCLFDATHWHPALTAFSLTRTAEAQLLSMAVKLKAAHLLRRLEQIDRDLEELDRLKNTIKDDRNYADRVRASLAEE